MAGNSLDLEDPSLGEWEQASDPITYNRFDPVEPPALVLTSRITEGESLERLVLRSDRDTGTAGYHARIGAELSEFYANPDFEYAATAERHVVPPKSSQQNCELHGMFDKAVGSGDPALVKKAYAIAARESGSLLHPYPGAQIELVTPQRTAAIATVQGAGEMIAPPEAGDATRDRFAAGQYLGPSRSHRSRALSERPGQRRHRPARRAGNRAAGRRQGSAAARARPARCGRRARNARRLAAGQQELGPAGGFRP